MNVLITVDNYRQILLVICKTSTFKLFEFLFQLNTFDVQLFINRNYKIKEQKLKIISVVLNILNFRKFNS